MREPSEARQRLQKKDFKSISVFLGYVFRAAKDFNRFLSNARSALMVFHFSPDRAGADCIELPRRRRESQVRVFLTLFVGFTRAQRARCLSSPRWPQAPVSRGARTARPS